MSSFYQDHRQVDAPWFDAIPAHWSMTRVGLAYQVSLGKMLQSSPKSENDRELPYLRSANVQAGAINIDDLNTMWFSQAEISDLTLRDGDLMITEGGDIGRCAMWTGHVKNCLYQNSVHRVRSDGSSTERFLFYWMNLVKNSGYLDVISNKATIAHLTVDKLNTLPLTLPPRDEQVAIAAFLDHETGKIDDLISEQEQLITLLDEKRQAVISHAVTKGLDPDVEMKDSGIEWLGEVPAHWEISRVREAARLLNGHPFNSDKFSQDTGYPLVRIRDLGCERTALLYDGEFVDAAKIDSGDLLIGMDGDFNVGRWKGRGYALLNQRVCCLRGQASIIRWLEYILPHPLKLINEVTYSTTVKHLSSGQVLDIRIPMPSEDERNELLNHLDKNVGLLSNLAETAEAGIALLKERRSALISAAVTGKIDVRNHPAAVAALNENKDN